MLVFHDVRDSVSAIDYLDSPNSGLAHTRLEASCITRKEFEQVSLDTLSYLLSEHFDLINLLFFALDSSTIILRRIHSFRSQKVFSYSQCPLPSPIRSLISLPSPSSQATAIFVQFRLSKRSCTSLSISMIGVPRGQRQNWTRASEAD